VLIDPLMPSVAAAEPARRLNERWPSLPVVVFISGYSMSGYSAEELRRQGGGSPNGR
jgi:hypothetical protein